MITDRSKTLALPGETIPLTTQLALGNNGDRLRDDERKWDYWGSVKLIHYLKKRTAADFIALGLELHWARLHLNKPGNWKQFLEDIDMNESATSRFRTFATRYMAEWGIIANPERYLVTKEAVVQAFNELEQNLAKLQGIDVDCSQFWGMSRHNVTTGSVEKRRILGLNAWKTLRSIRDTYWGEELPEVIDTLRVWQALIEQVIVELESESNVMVKE